MQSKRPTSNLLTRLWWHVSVRRRRQLVALGGLMLLGTGAELVSLGLVVPFLGVLTAPEHFLAHPRMGQVLAWMGLSSREQVTLGLTVLFCAAAVLSGVARLSLLWGQTRIANAIGNDLGTDVYRRTLYQPYLVQTTRNSGEIVAALMTKINTIVYFIIIPFLAVVTSAVVVLTILGFMFFVDPELTAIAFAAFGLLYGVVGYGTRTQLTKDSRQVNEKQNRLAKIVQEGLGGVRDVLIGGFQETYIRSYYAADVALRRAHANINILAGAPRPVIEAFGLVLIGVLLFVTLKQRESATVVPMLGALALAAQRLLPLVQQGFAGWTSIRGGRDSLADVLVLLEQPLRDEGPRPAPIAFAHEIRLADLQFRYGTASSVVLDKIDLCISKGSRVGFIGATGSGKSTLLDIVMGLLPPTGGALRIDGVAVDEGNRRAWQAHIAHVPQSIFLTDATVAENIAFGVASGSIDRERVRTAAHLAQIGDTIESWPNGYETVVGERGVNLSGGQRQRIGIARALYRRADVIVLDEATSALDSDTESKVMQAIDALHEELTILIVTHRISTLKNCDKIVELRHGTIQRVCTYRELAG